MPERAEHIHETFGISLLGRRIEPQERLRWNEVRPFAEQAWQHPVTGLFLLAVPSELPAALVPALIATGNRLVPLAGEGEIVDIAIQRIARALVERDADVNCDRDLVLEAERLAAGDARVGILALREFIAGSLRDIDGMEFFEFRYGVASFQHATTAGARQHNRRVSPA